MKKYLLCYLLITVVSPMTKAQQKKPVGIYMLQGVREMASGFELKADSTFEFFFSYGALDRYGKGKWKQEGNKIILNSSPKPGKDFKLTDSSKTAGEFIFLQFDLKNTVLNNYIYAYSGKLKNDEYPARANGSGLIKLPATTDSIHVLFEFVPERESVFSLNTKNFNHFTFTMEPWITDVYFIDFSLTLSENKLEGKHPLITKEHCEYVKEN